VQGSQLVEILVEHKHQPQMVIALLSW